MKHQLHVEVNTGECSRCHESGKIPNPKAGPHLIDCPDCEGTGRVEVQPESCSAEEIELERLHKLRESSKRAASDMGRLFALLAKGLEKMEVSPFNAQLKSFAAEGIASSAALVELLGGDR